MGGQDWDASDAGGWDACGVCEMLRAIDTVDADTEVAEQGDEEEGRSERGETGQEEGLHGISPGLETRRRQME